MYNAGHIYRDSTEPKQGDMDSQGSQQQGWRSQVRIKTSLIPKPSNYKKTQLASLHQMHANKQTNQKLKAGQKCAQL
jgi:hypothetical protein